MFPSLQQRKNAKSAACLHYEAPLNTERWKVNWSLNQNRPCPTLREHDYSFRTVSEKFGFSALIQIVFGIVSVSILILLLIRAEIGITVFWISLDQRKVRNAFLNRLWDRTRIIFCQHCRHTQKTFRLVIDKFWSQIQTALAKS